MCDADLCGANLRLADMRDADLMTDEALAKSPNRETTHAND